MGSEEATDASTDPLAIVDDAHGSSGRFRLLDPRKARLCPEHLDLILRLQLGQGLADHPPALVLDDAPTSSDKHRGVDLRIPFVLSSV